MSQLAGHALTVHRCMLAAVVVDAIRDPDYDTRDCNDKEWQDQHQMLRLLCAAYIDLLAEAGWKPKLNIRAPMGRRAV